MSDVFASLDRATLVETPFPHLMVEDALPATIADTLVSEMPPLEVFTMRSAAASPRRKIC